MIIHRLALSGFKLIRDPIALEFPEEGRIGIFGANESGKSTLLESVAFTLYGLKRRGTVSEQRENVVSWGKNRARLELEFSSGENRYLLQREVNVKGGHTARLWTIADGQKKGLETNLTRIQGRIEEITGMDRDSFSKLIYIRQNDLDALKEMLKAKREQLVNKVMGIEIFDEATGKVNDDSRQMKQDLTPKKAEFEHVARDKEEYEEQIAARKTLQNAKNKLEKKIAKQKQRLEEKEILVKKYDWLADRKSKTSLRTEMQGNIRKLNDRLQELKDRRTEKQGLEEALKKYEGTDEVLETLRNIKGVRTEIGQTTSRREEKEKALGEASTQAQRQRNFLKTHETTYQHLTGCLEKYSEQERQLDAQQQELQQFEEQKNLELQKHKIPEKDMDELTANLSQRKSQQLLISIPLIVMGIVLASMSLIVNIFLIAVGVPLLAVGFVFFSRYRRLERLANLSVNIQSLIGSIGQKKQKIDGLNRGLDGLRAETRFHSSTEIESKISDIISTLRSEIGLESFDALNAVLKKNEDLERPLKGETADLGATLTSLRKQLDDLSSGIEVPPDLDKGIKKYEAMSRKRATLNGKLDGVNDNIQKIEGENSQAALEGLEERLGEIDEELENLEKDKPEDVAAVKYSERSHKKAKKDLEKVRDLYGDLKQDLATTSQGLKDVEEVIGRVKPGYDRYPRLEAEIAGLEGGIRLLERVTREMKETSKELRNRVLPQARYIINQILPTLTDGRYSDLEISEDLQFKVHSNEAGGYKERDVFSGGTQDQFLIALRLAFTQSILDSRVRADYYSLLMDECISSSDEVRKQAIFEVLDLKKETFRQIFVVAHEDISNLVDHHLVLARNANNYCEVKSKSW